LPRGRRERAAPPSFGAPRHRLIAAVLAPNATAAAPQIVRGARHLARRFAPLAPPSVEVDLDRDACEHRPVPTAER
jgi:hypothetical protein